LLVEKDSFLTDNDSYNGRNRMKKQVIIISGQPGTGKTTIGKHFAEYLDIAFFDKDIICDDFTFHIMSNLYGKQHDKDGDDYKNNVRYLEYKTIQNIMMSQFELNLSFVVVAPFTNEIQNGFEYFDEIEEQARLREYDIYFIHIKVDEEELKSRIIKRNKPEDKHKIDNWEHYVQRFREDNLRTSVKIFVNTNIDDTIEDIINYIN
jgi:deoxyadenosine/deoxycytidine kinase